MTMVTMQCLPDDDDHVPETSPNEDDDHAPETPGNEDADVIHDGNRTFSRNMQMIIQDAMLKFKIHPHQAGALFSVPTMPLPLTKSFLRPKGFFENVKNIKDYKVIVNHVQTSK